MKNKEKYKDELLKILCQGDGFAVNKETNEPCHCHSLACPDCKFGYSLINCKHEREKWLKELYDPKYADFAPKNGCVYYFIGDNYEVQKKTWLNDSLDKNRLKVGNVCMNRIYMEGKAAKIKLYSLLSNFAEKVNEGWEPNWENRNEDKWFCYYNPFMGNWIVFDSSEKTTNTVYFKSKELVQRAVEDIVIPFERGEL